MWAWCMVGRVVVSLLPTAAGAGPRAPPRLLLPCPAAVLHDMAALVHLGLHGYKEVELSALPPSVAATLQASGWCVCAADALEGQDRASVWGMRGRPLASRLLRNDASLHTKPLPPRRLRCLSDATSQARHTLVLCRCWR